MVELNVSVKRTIYTLTGKRIIIRKARKTHYCYNCNLHIFKGEKEKEITGFNEIENRFYTIYICERCF